MTIWLTALKLIPWDQVLANTPALINGAKKLLHRTQEIETPAEAPPAAADERQRLDFVQRRVLEQQRELHSLHERLEESAVLIQSLTDQNAQLVAVIETLRQQFRKMAIAGAVAGAGLLGAVIYLLAR